MTLTQLDYFYAVCDYMSISKAAESRFVTQPAISKSLKLLEKEFGIKLFTVKNRQINLTKEGEMLYDMVVPLMDNIKMIDTLIKESYIQSSTSKIAIASSIGPYIIPLIIQECDKSFPENQVAVFETYFSAILADVLREQVDMGIILTNREHPEIERILLRNTSLVYCIDKSHPLNGAASVTFHDICSFPLIVDRLHPTRSISIVNWMESKGATPNIIMYSRQCFEAFQSLRGNIGYIAVRETAISNPDVTFIPISEPEAQLGIYLIWKPQRIITSTNAKLMKLVRKILGRQSDSEYLRSGD